MLQEQRQVAPQVYNTTPQHTGTTDAVQDLPTEVLLHLVTVLPSKAYFHLALTCKHFYALVLEATGVEHLKELVPGKEDKYDYEPNRPSNEFATLLERWMSPRWKRYYICHRMYVRDKERMCIQCETRLRDVL